MSWEQLELELAEMFERFSSHEHDEASFVFAVERTYDRRRGKAELERMRYRMLKANRERWQAFSAHKTQYSNEYQKRRRASDPVWAEQKRARTREAMRRLREQRKQDNQRRAA